jgi:hypothetical protein
LQRVEVRAYGCLLEELIGRCDWLDADAPIAAKLVALKETCLSDDVGSRPLFADLVAVLRQLAGAGDRDAAVLAAI